MASRSTLPRSTYVFMAMVAVGVVDLILYYAGLPPFREAPKWGLTLGFGLTVFGFIGAVISFVTAKVVDSNQTSSQHGT